MSSHPGPLMWSVQLAATASALGCAQREVWRVVKSWGLGQVADVVELLALELVSVAIGASGRHAAGPPRYRDLRQMRLLELRFQLEARGLVVATWDDDLRTPPMRQAGTGSGDGGELYWVPMLAAAWDFFRSGDGKVVWAEIRVPGAGQRWLPQRVPMVRPAPLALPANLDPSLLARVVRGLRQLNVAKPPAAVLADGQLCPVTAACKLVTIGNV